MTETITLPVDAVNKAFDDELHELRRTVESVNLPGFTDFDAADISTDVNHGRVEALFLITRIEDGKVFGAKYDNPVVDYEYAETPFYKGFGDVTFTEVIKKTRTITVDYWEFAE
jgi:hypothetical protein